MSRRRYRIPLRRLSRSRRPRLLFIVVLVLLLATRWLFPETGPPAPESLQAGIYRVERIVDGDTLVIVDCGKVRLIGANTPETVDPNRPVEPWGPEATVFTRQFVAGGEVRLEFDGPRTDKFRRILAHVWVGDRMLAEELIWQAGHGRNSISLRSGDQSPLGRGRSRSPRRRPRNLVAVVGVEEGGGPFFSPPGNLRDGRPVAKMPSLLAVYQTRSTTTFVGSSTSPQPLEPKT